MTIVFCNTIQSWGGGEKWHLETAKELLAKGHEVSFILHPKGVIAHKLPNSTIKRIPAKIGNLTFINPIAHLFFIIKLLIIKPDAIIFNRPAELKSIALAARIAGIKNIIYRRGSDVRVKNNPLNRLFLEQIATHIIANSTATKASLLESGLDISSKITVINNGIIMPIDTHSAQMTKHNSAPIVIGAAGRLVEQKGFDLLLESANLLKERGLNFQIQIAGEGIDREKLERLIATYQLKKHIALKGFVSNMTDFFHMCDFFVLPSRYEGFGYVMVEAMFAKKPVIAFDISSAKEIIQNNVTGFLIPAYNTQAFANKMELLITNSGLRDVMGDKGFRRAMENYTINKATDRLLKLII